MPARRHVGLAAGCLPRKLMVRHGVPVGLHDQGRRLRAAARLSGTELLIYVGLFMIFYGIVYAILENDMRRILAYSIVNQVGFMVAGIGIGTEMALNGTAAHAFTHIVYKALLLMSAGSVLYMTGKRKCTDLGGLFRTMPLTTICGIVGALSISSFPLTSGFVSKSMISEAAANQHLELVWFLLRRLPPVSSCTPASSFPGSSSSRRTLGSGPPIRPGTCAWPWCFFPRSASALACCPAPLCACCPITVDYVPYTAVTWSRNCNCCCSPAWRFS